MLDAGTASLPGDRQIFPKNAIKEPNFSDICSMNPQWQGLLGYLKYLIKRNPE
jgi:hypothetical protein